MAKEEPRLVAPAPKTERPAADTIVLLNLTPGALVTMWVDVVDPS